MGQAVGWRARQGAAVTPAEAITVGLLVGAAFIGLPLGIAIGWFYGFGVGFRDACQQFSGDLADALSDDEYRQAGAA